MNTSILIRVQARGGKFLGPDIGYSTVTVRNAQTGQVLASGPAGQSPNDSGVLYQTTVSNNCAAPPNASSGVVLTYPGPQVWYLTTNPGKTAFFQANFDIANPMLIDIAAEARGITASGRMWIEPGSQLLTEPGYIVTMPGLAVDIKAVANPFVVSAEVTANVTMMCGCKINDKQTDPDGKIQWPSSEFQVWGEMRSGGVAVTKSAPFNLTQTSSVYYGTVPFPPNKGNYELAVVAVQASESNVGIATRAIQT